MLTIGCAQLLRPVLNYMNMASSLPSASSPDPLVTPAAYTDAAPHVHAVPAVIEWKADDGQSRYVGCSPNNPAHLFFQFDAPAKTGSFKLSVDFAWRKIGTRVQRRHAPLYLCLGLSSLRRLSLDLSCPSPPPDEFLGPLGRELACVSVEMVGFPALVAPDWPLTPQNRSHNPALDSVKCLAQLSAFNVYVQRGSARAIEDLGSLCTAVASSEAWPADASGDTTEFYDGRHGKVIGVDLLAPGAAPPNVTRPPPAYSDLEPPPPTAPLIEAKKRRRASSGSGATRDELALIRDRMELLEKRTSESERTSNDVKQRVRDLEQRLAKVEHERDSARRRVEQLEDQLREGLVKGKGQVEQVNEDLQALETCIDDRVWVEVDDLRTAVRGDFDELQQELRGSVADLVQDALEGAVQSQLAAARICVRDGILEVRYDDG